MLLDYIDSSLMKNKMERSEAVNFFAGSTPSSIALECLCVLCVHRFLDYKKRQKLEAYKITPQKLAFVCIWIWVPQTHYDEYQIFCNFSFISVVFLSLSSLAAAAVATMMILINDDDDERSDDACDWRFHLAPSLTLTII